jgi:hypothetical protein
MCLKKKEREFFRKLLENFIVKNTQFKQSKVVDHFVRAGIARQTVYNGLNRHENGQSILKVTRSGPPSSWTSSMMVKLKRLVNHRKGVSQNKLGYTFSKHQTTIGRQIQKLHINEYVREKTPKYTEENK